MVVRSSLGGVAAILLGTVVGLAACMPGLGATPELTAEPEPQENMPLYASIWLTAEPPVPEAAVQVDLMILPEAEINRSHTFVAGTALRGSFPVSQGDFRMIGLGGKCGIDLVLAPESQTDVVITVPDTGGCSFSVVREHKLADGITHEEPSVLVEPD